MRHTMRSLGAAVTLLLCAVAVGAAPEARPQSVLEFAQAHGQRRYERVPRQVLAFYYNWYGRPERHGKWVHWKDVDTEKRDIASSTHYPLKGAYDSFDPEIVDWQLSLAKEQGITGFIATWWGQGSFEDRALPLLLERAEKKAFKVCVYWEAAPGKGQDQIERAARDIIYLVKKYGGHNAYLRVDGKPVLFAYGRLMQQVPLASWPAIHARVRQECPSDFLLIADGYQESFARTFDGLHTYNVCGWVQKKTPEQLRPLAARNFTNAVQLARTHARLSCLTIIPGYNDTKIRKPGINAERQDGQTYRVLWEEAIKADPDWILITSWNEWHEGSELEPSVEHGDKYLKITGEYAPRFLSTPFSKARVPASPSTLAPAKMRALRKLYEGKTIGVLPDYGGSVVFWLADAGLKLKELSWEDVLNAQEFNAKTVPVVLYAAHERYTRTVKEAGDVDAALRRYLGEGGLLVALSHGPFPFYHDEAGKPTVGAGRLGFPIAGSGVAQRNDVPTGAQVRGWEAPPADTALSFQVDGKALAGVRANAPFPTTGDRRWRPATPTLTAKGDVYLPLAQLKDAAGNWYGDGIAYVEHRESEPRGGKNLYMWMRMPDVLGQDDTLFSLFRFAAEKAAGW